MKIIEIKTQKELDILPKSFEEYTLIRIYAEKRIIVSVARENSSVEAMGRSSVVAWGRSSVKAMEESSVVAWGRSSVVAWGNSSVKAMEESSVKAMEESSVVAMGRSSVVAWGNSSVVAWGNSSVKAMEESSVVARENSSVEAMGRSSVVAWGNVSVHLMSSGAVITLFMYAVCWKMAEGKITKKAKTAQIIIPKVKKGVKEWLKSQGIKPTSKVIVYKKVSKEFKTQEGTYNETLYTIGKIIEISNWTPKNDECGEGKLHACSKPYFCDEFRNENGDRYIAIEVNQKDMYAWPNPAFPHKIAFRRGKVLYEVDRFGSRI